MALPRNPSYPTTVNDITAVIPMIETVEALNHLDDILSVDGVHAIYVGPADLSLSLGLPPGNNDDRPEFTEALTTIVAACRRHGVVPGMHTVASLAARRLEQGFQMLTISNDLLAMRSALVAELANVRGAAKPTGSTSVY